jgi:hypothetical protein
LLLQTVTVQVTTLLKVARSDVASDSDEDGLFSPATWRHDDEEIGEGAKSQDVEGVHKHCHQKVSGMFLEI